jgi:hypothetical protein
MTPLDFGKPVRTFRRNLAAMGYRFTLDADGGLVVDEPPNAPPILRDEIIKRAPLLVKLVELDGLCGRPLLDDEAARCRQLAKECGVSLSWERFDLNTHEVERDIFNGDPAPDGADEMERLAELNVTT